MQAESIKQEACRILDKLPTKLHGMIYGRHLQIST